MKIPITTLLALASSVAHPVDAINPPNSLTALDVHHQAFRGLKRRDICRQVAEGEYETQSLASWKTIFIKGDIKGHCGDLCPSLCEAEKCNGFQVSGDGRCTCGTYLCSTNAQCISSAGTCQCDDGFHGDGQTCCNQAAGSQFVQLLDGNFSCSVVETSCNQDGDCGCDQERGYGPICHYDPATESYSTVCATQDTLLSGLDIFAQDYPGECTESPETVITFQEFWVANRLVNGSFSNVEDLLLPDGSAVPEFEHITAMVRDRIPREYAVEVTDESILQVFMGLDNSSERRSLLNFEAPWDSTEIELDDRDLSLVSGFMGECAEAVVNVVSSIIYVVVVEISVAAASVAKLPGRLITKGMYKCCKKSMVKMIKYLKKAVKNLDAFEAGNTINFAFIWKALVELANGVSLALILNGIASSLKWYQWVTVGVLIAVEFAAKLISGGTSHAVNKIAQIAGFIELGANIIIMSQNCFDWPIEWVGIIDIPDALPPYCWDAAGNRGQCYPECDAFALKSITSEATGQDPCSPTGDTCCFLEGSAPKCTALGFSGECQDDASKCKQKGASYGLIQADFVGPCNSCCIHEIPCKENGVQGVCVDATLDGTFCDFPLIEDSTSCIHSLGSGWSCGLSALPRCTSDTGLTGICLDTSRCNDCELLQPSSDCTSISPDFECCIDNPCLSVDGAQGSCMDISALCDVPAWEASACGSGDKCCIARNVQCKSDDSGLDGICRAPATDNGCELSLLSSDCNQWGDFIKCCIKEEDFPSCSLWNHKGSCVDSDLCSGNKVSLPGLCPEVMPSSVGCCIDRPDGVCVAQGKFSGLCNTESLCIDAGLVPMDGFDDPDLACNPDKVCCVGPLSCESAGATTTMVGRCMDEDHCLGLDREPVLGQTEKCDGGKSIHCCLDFADYSCNKDGVSGACMDKDRCTGANQKLFPYPFADQSCPGSAEVQCCIDLPSCSWEASGVTYPGTCVQSDTSCIQDGGLAIAGSNYCPGGDDMGVVCCVEQVPCEVYDGNKVLENVGNCRKTSLCDTAKYEIAPGLCPLGADDQECCVPKPVTCEVYDGTTLTASGTCRPNSVCNANTHYMVEGLCTEGIPDFECCIPKPPPICNVGNIVGSCYVENECSLTSWEPSTDCLDAGTGCCYDGPPTNPWTPFGNDVNGFYAYGYFGNDVALSDDGLVMAVGAYRVDLKGMVQVFEYSNEKWHQRGQNLTGLGEDDYFGDSIALSGHGMVLAVGAPSGGYAQVFVYRPNDDEWQQVGGIFNGTDPLDTWPENRYGYSISLSQDGWSLAIGGAIGDYSTGRIKVFEYITAIQDWAPLGKDITGVRSPADSSFSADGRTLAIGSSWFNGVYKYDSGVDEWKQQGRILPAGPVALSGDGSRLVIGKELISYTTDPTTYNGRIVVYDYNGTDWLLKGQPVDVSGVAFGRAVAISRDGQLVASGGFSLGSFSSDEGYAKVYAWDDSKGQWSQLGINLESKLFSSIAFSQNGTVVAVGSAQNRVPDSFHPRGQVKVYRYEQDV